jgi:hypothetical protein
MSPTESDIFCWGGGLKKADACGFFGVLLGLLLLLVGVYVAAVVAALLCFLWSPFGSCSAALLRCST